VPLGGDQSDLVFGWDGRFPLEKREELEHTPIICFFIATDRAAWERLTQPYHQENLKKKLPEHWDVRYKYYPRPTMSTVGWKCILY
jgi:hypothetical protein